MSSTGNDTTPLTLLAPAAPGGAWPVELGAIWHNAWEVKNIRRKFCKPIFALTGNAQFPYCLMASSGTIEIAGRHFLFCCHHQIREYAPDRSQSPYRSNQGL